MTKYLSLESMISFVEGKVRSDNVMPMEDLPINNGAGQSYGYILYRTVLPDSAKELVIEGVKDYGQVFISQKAKEVIKWPTTNARISINSLGKALKGRVLDILVENCGRVNVGRRMVDQRKGIIGKVEVDKQQQTRWEMVPLDFNDMFVKNLLKSRSLWVDIPFSLNLSPPAMFKGSFSITGKPKDTFLDMKGWNKGVVFINSHNLGRYWKIGPQETLYVPAPWLQEGPNTIMIFEQHPSTSDVVKLVKEHRLGPRMEHQGH